MTHSILIVDDSEVVLAVTRSLLEGAGYRVVTHARATGSVALILQVKPDLVLLDVNMPSLKGDAVAKMASGTAQATGTVVLLHSSLEDHDLERLARESGAHGFIKKTDNAFSLLRQIRSFLAPESTSRVLVRPPAIETERLMPPQSEKRQQLDQILLIDRDMSCLSHMRDLLRGLGFRSEFALSTMQALHKLESGEPPVRVIVSAQMPNSGFIQMFEGAVALNPGWAELFILTTEPEKNVPLPRDFRGPVVKKPVTQILLKQALERTSVPRTVGRPA